MEHQKSNKGVTSFTFVFHILTLKLKKKKNQKTIKKNWSYIFKNKNANKYYTLLTYQKSLQKQKAIL